MASDSSTASGYTEKRMQSYYFFPFLTNLLTFFYSVSY